MYDFIKSLDEKRQELLNAPGALRAVRPDIYKTRCDAALILKEAYGKLDELFSQYPSYNQQKEMDQLNACHNPKIHQPVRSSE